jgi:hypothetical protein
VDQDAFDGDGIGHMERGPLARFIS